jgi:hypothetical protein
MVAATLAGSPPPVVAPSAEELLLRRVARLERTVDRLELRLDRERGLRHLERRRGQWRRTARPYRGWLARTRWCESRGDYSIATGNGFFGAYQFTRSSWRAVGGRGLPHHAERLEQDYRAVLLLRRQGRGAWPVCG